MRKLTILLLAISFLLVFGCAATSKQPSSDNGHGLFSAVNPYFSDQSQDYAYRTRIEVYGRELNGILIAKKISDSIHRVVLTTDFGNTLFDFEVGQNTFVKNHIVEDLDRKIIVNTLRDDFRLLFRGSYASHNAQQTRADSVMTYESRERRNLYRISFSGKKLISIVKRVGKKDRVSVGFHGESDIFAEKIEIQHHDIKLKIRMDHFQ